MNKSIIISGLLFIFSISMLSVSVDAQDLVIERGDKAQQACKELSAESLSEVESTLKEWRAQSVNYSDGFAVEGQWQTDNGRYWVECNVSFGGTINDIELTITKE